MGQINELCKRAHENAVNRGFYEQEPNFPTLIALIHSEASEALEYHRNGLDPNEEMFGCKGIPYELADIIIRTFDMCGFYGIDIESAIYEKMEYNENRQYKHGKEY